MKTYDQMLKDAEKKISRDVSKVGRLEIPPPNVISQGNRTFITNFIDVANSIRRDPKHLAKFLFRELAIPGHLDNNRLVLQGKAMKILIHNIIDAYMKEFVVCRECNRPDTQIIKEGRLIFLKCEACGAKQPLRRITAL